MTQHKSTIVIQTIEVKAPFTIIKICHPILFQNHIQFLILLSQQYQDYFLSQNCRPIVFAEAFIISISNEELLAKLKFLGGGPQPLSVVFNTIASGTNN
jgi:hypothetical protein